METEKLKSIYEELYQMNYDGGDEEYLEEYEARFSPENLDASASADEVLSMLKSLVGEILEDTGDRLQTAAWAIEAGADAALLDELGLA